MPSVLATLTAMEELSVAAVGAHWATDQDPSSPHVHVALAGVIGAAERVLSDASLISSLADTVRDRFIRDRQLLTVAQTAREKRGEVAWQKLGL